MPEEIPVSQPEKKEAIDDNARKFILDAIDPQFLRGGGAISYDLVTDWLITDAASEKKVVYKKFESREVEYFAIEKISDGRGRKTNKKKISEGEYKILLGSSILRSAKRRSDFNFVQNGTSFAMKYDEFPNEKLHMLEIDAATETERTKFNIDEFPFKLTEVTGDLRYYGYRVAETIAARGR